MGGRVAPAFPLVVGPGHDPAVDHRHRPHRDVAVVDRGPGLVEGDGHGRVVVVQRNDSFSGGHDEPTIGEEDGSGRAGDARIVFLLAEGVGFEPTRGCPLHALQACRIGRSRTPPCANNGIVTGEVPGRRSTQRLGPAQRNPVNRVRAGRQQLSAAGPVCRSPAWPLRRSAGPHRRAGPVVNCPSNRATPPCAPVPRVPPTGSDASPPARAIGSPTASIPGPTPSSWWRPWARGRRSWPRGPSGGTGAVRPTCRSSKSWPRSRGRYRSSWPPWSP